MSFTTRCPACGTMFRVVADQLKISEGWVRCGHCADVFDATQFLQPWTAPSPEDHVPASPAEEASEPVPSMSHAPAPWGSEPTAEPEDEVEAEQVALRDGAPTLDVQPNEAGSESVAEAVQPLWSTESNPDPKDERTQGTPSQPEPARDEDPDEIESDFHGELERFAAGLGRLNAVHVAQVAGVHNAVADGDAPPPAHTDAAPAVPEAPAPEAPDREPGEALRADAGDAVDSVQSDLPLLEPGFVRQARRQAYWRKPGVRVALSLVALLLAALLTAQWAVHERNRLAASRPGLQPWLQQACAHLGCSLAPVRRIDAIVIDSASLVNRLGNFYSFDLVLKNTASMVLAVPALELSLTDIGGAVIARRVFLPHEWPDAPAVLPANGSVTVNFRLALAVDESTPMAGYNALVFYP